MPANSVNNKNEEKMANKQSVNSVNGANPQSVEPVIFERDEFCGDEYLDKSAQLPLAIVMNDQLHCGLFLTATTLAKIGFVPEFDESVGEVVDHTFRNGKTESGLLITKPRMLLAVKTDLLVLDKKATLDTGRKVIVGVWSSAYKNDPKYIGYREYAGFLMSADNKALHSLPIRISAKGVFGATLYEQRSKFKSELEACHAKFNKIPAKSKTENFHALGVFCFTIEPQLKGTKQNKSWCATVVAHENPTIDNWTKYFIGGHGELKEYIWESLEPMNKLNLVANKESKKLLPESRN